ncbi:cytochrome b [Acinetobacter sp. ANC 3781]
MNNNYPKPMIIMHWITFVLVVIVYLTSGDPTRTGLQGQIHVIGGISIFILFFVRLIFVFFYKRNIPQNEIINPYQIKLFKIVRFALYVSLCVVPIAGWLALSSFTDNFQVFSLNLPLLSSVREVKYIGQIHQFLGNFFITVVGLHACAALIHHFIFKDNVLKSMLFKKMK